MRRLADYYLNRARTWDEMKKAHRSPQLTLWTLGPDEWLLFLKLPDYAARKKPQRKPDVIQLPLLGLDGDHTNAPEALG